VITKFPSGHPVTHCNIAASKFATAGERMSVYDAPVYDATVSVSGVNPTVAAALTGNWQFTTNCNVLQWRQLETGKSTNPRDTVWCSALLCCKLSGHFVYRPV